MKRARATALATVWVVALICVPVISSAQSYQGFFGGLADAVSGLFGPSAASDPSQSRQTNHQRTQQGGRPGQPGASESPSTEPELRMPFAKFRKLLQQQLQEDGVANITEPLDKGAEEDVDFSALDPCQRTDMLRDSSWVVGVISWAGHLPEEWNYTNPRALSNPCLDEAFADHLAETGAWVAVFRLSVESLCLMRTSLIADELVQLIASENRVQTSAMYSLAAISPPQIVVSLDSEITNTTGIASFYPVLVHSQLTLESVFGKTDFTVEYLFTPPADDCCRCLNLNNNITELIDSLTSSADSQTSTDFFEQASVAGIVADTEEDLFSFTCFNNVTCAWGWGWCGTCLQALLNDRPDAGVFDIDQVANGNVSAAEEIDVVDYSAAIDSMVATCLTLCTTTYQVGWYGVDQYGLQLYTGVAMMEVINGFDMMTVFQPYFGIDEAILRSVSKNNFGGSPSPNPLPSDCKAFLNNDTMVYEV